MRYVLNTLAYVNVLTAVKKINIVIILIIITTIIIIIIIIIIK